MIHTILPFVVLAGFTSPAFAQCPGDDIHEPNQSCATAVALTAGTTSGLAILGDDHDMWAFTVPPGEDLEIDVLFLHPNGNIEVKLVTSDCNNLIDSSYSSDDDEHVSGHNSGAVPEVMVLHVFGIGPNFVCNDYSLAVTIGQPNMNAYCFADLGNPTGNFCPCGNENDGSDPDGAGCANGTYAAGARLYGGGVASLAADSLVLYGVRGQPNNSSMFFQAHNDLDGLGVFLDDGIQCAGGTLKRLQVKLNNSAGNANTTNVISVRSANLGDPLQPGDTRYYQWWFRDNVNPPCGLGVNDANTSNGFMVTWLP